MKPKRVVKKNLAGEIVEIFPYGMAAVRADNIPESSFQSGMRLGILERGNYTYQYMDSYKNAVYRAPTATLCWTCGRACGGPNGCSWSREYKPVEGWDAERRDVAVWRGESGRQYTEYSESYYVKGCPEYVADRKE